MYRQHMMELRPSAMMSILDAIDTGAMPVILTLVIENIGLVRDAGDSERKPPDGYSGFLFEMVHQSGAPGLVPCAQSF